MRKKRTEDQEVKAGTQRINVAPAPHLSSISMTTQKMMTDVMIALMPVVFMSIFIFRAYAIKQLFICITASLAAEALFVKMRGKALTLNDFSAVVTGIILAMSLPGTAPWYVGVIASIVAIGIGKIIFGGLGMNIFNPAMVGRAFVMISFAGALAASGYEDPQSVVDAISQATPMDLFKQGGYVPPLSDLFWGTTNGSLGETSAIACILGGIYLCVRRTASWQIPAGLILAVCVIGLVHTLLGSESGWTIRHHLFGGAMLFGAFFIATDPVTSPLTGKGKFIFGVGVGFFIMLLRLFSGYPEGVMFAVLLMNALTPLINRWTVPMPFGGN